MTQNHQVQFSKVYILTQDENEHNIQAQLYINEHKIDANYY